MTAARRDRDRLADITEAATKIADRVQHGRDRFDTDEDLQIVLTHLIQIIGEAATRLSAALVSSDHPEVPWRALIGMRHRVVHDYEHEPVCDALWAHRRSVGPTSAHPKLGADVRQPTPTGELARLNASGRPARSMPVSRW